MHFRAIVIGDVGDAEEFLEPFADDRWDYIHDSEQLLTHRAGYLVRSAKIGEVTAYPEVHAVAYAADGWPHWEEWAGLHDHSWPARVAALLIELPPGTLITVIGYKH